MGDNEELNDLFILKEKNKEFSSIIHTMRHDIRNYIAAIEGYAYLLRDEFNEDYLKRIFTNIENINVLVDRSVLFADAPLDIEKSSEIDLNILLKSFNELIPNKITLESDTLLKVQGDYSKIQFIFKTILENAVVHGNPTTIEIKGQIQEDENYTIQLLNDGLKIPQEKAQKLFVQLPQSLKVNSGLNLIISKRIAQAHNWQLLYKPEITDKTCFELIIPKSSLV